MQGIEYLIKALGAGLLTISVFGLLFGSKETIMQFAFSFVVIILTGIAVLGFIHLAKNWSSYE